MKTIVSRIQPSGALTLGNYLGAIKNFVDLQNSLTQEQISGLKSDFEKLSEEEIEAVELNKSIIHVDFMIGSKDLSIVAETYDGKTVQIFKDGTWSI